LQALSRWIFEGISLRNGQALHMRSKFSLAFEDTLSTSDHTDGK
jgi:hypothetical protein